MPDRSSILDLPYILPSQAQKHVTHNEALRKLDVLVQLTVQEIDAQDPPGAPSEGDVYALGTAANGAWAGHDGELAAWLDAAWYFIVPQTGWHAWDTGTGSLRIWNGNTWTTVSGGSMESVPKIGVNASADAVNRLTVSSDATLLNNAGNGHQLKLNKAGQSDTVSLLYQTSYTGHAEMGLNGSNDFSIKVSADGSAWTDALSIDGATGAVTGNAVQATPIDRADGKLLTVGAFGMGERVVRYSSSHDLNQVRNLSALIGNSETDDVPAHAPTSDGAFVGFCGSLGGVRGAQFLVETTGTEDAYFRVDENGWSDWKRIVSNENMVGTVAQVGGTPTGAVIERGQNGNGEYVRFADGTQFATNANQPITNSPAPFVGPITKIDGDKLWLGTWF